MKRLVSLLTAVLFLFTMLPVGALAAGESFTVKNSAGAELASNAKIDTVEGVLALEVANADLVDLSAITISGYNGAVVAEKKTDTEIEVKFGRLTEGEHTLTVGEEEFTFNAEKYYLTDVDFNDYTAADALNTKLEADKMGVIYGSGTSGNYGYDGYEGYNYGTIKTYQSGAQKNNNYLSLHPANNSRTDFTKYNTLGLVVRGDVTDENGEYYLPDGNFNSKKNVVGNKVYVMDACTSVSTITAGYGTLGTGTQRIGNGGSTLLLSAWKPYTTAGNWYEGVDTATAIPNSSEMKWPRMVLARGDDGGLVQHLYSKEQGLDTYYYVGGKYGSVTEDDTVAQLTVLAHIGAYTASTNTARDLRFRKVSCYPERLLSVLDVEVSTDESNTVVLHMSDDVLESTSGDVAVTGATSGEVSGFTQEIDNDNRTITLTFADGLAADTYTIDISALYGSNQLKAYTGTEAFKLETAWEEVKIAAPVVTDYFGNELGENGKIRTIDGVLTLTFEEAINENTISGITVENAGKVIKELSEDGKVVTLKFGRLAENTDYTLKAQNVRTAEEGRGVRNLEFDFTAYRAYLTDTDFAGWTDANLADNLAEQNLASLNGWSSNEGAGFAKVQADGENNYISVSPNHNNGTKNKAYGLVVNANANMDSNFNTTETVSGNHVFVIESAVALDYTGGTTSSFGLPNTATGASAINGTGNSILGVSNDYQAVNMEFSDEVVLNALDNTAYRYKGVDGWRAPRMVLRRDSEDGDLLQDAYDMNNGGMLIGTVKNYNETSDSTTTKHILSSTQTIARFGLLTEYLSSTKLGFEFKYNYVKAYPDMLAGVLEADFTDDSATVYFSDDIDQDTLAGIVVYNGETVLEDDKYNADYDTAGRKLTISYNTGVQPTRIDMSKLKATSGLRMYSEDAVQVCKVTVITDVTFKDGNGTKIEDATALAAATKVSVTATITDAPESVVAFLAVYGDDANGNSILLAVKEATIEDGTITAETDTFTAGATRAQLFVWKSIESLTPLLKTDAGQCL